MTHLQVRQDLQRPKPKVWHYGQATYPFHVQQVLIQERIAVKVLAQPVHLIVLAL